MIPSSVQLWTATWKTVSIAIRLTTRCISRTHIFTVRERCRASCLQRDFRWSRLWRSRVRVGWRATSTGCGTIPFNASDYSTPSARSSASQAFSERQRTLWRLGGSGSKVKKRRAARSAALFLSLSLRQQTLRLGGQVGDPGTDIKLRIGPHSDHGRAIPGDGENTGQSNSLRNVRPGAHENLLQRLDADLLRPEEWLTCP